MRPMAAPGRHPAMTRAFPHRDDHVAYELATYDLLGLSTASAVTATLVREARRGAGVSQAELARRCGVPEQVVALWEDPTWEGDSLSTLRRVARALELRLELRMTPTRQRSVQPADEPVAA